MKRFGVAGWSAVVLVAAVLVGCSSEPGKGPRGVASPGEMRWVEVSDDAVATGRALFGTCAPCHNADATGRVGIGPRIASRSYLAAASDDFLVRTIKDGRAGTTMVAWSERFDDDQIEAIVAYLRSLHRVDPAALDQSPIVGDATRGGDVFRSICSGCHGRNGGGYQESANGTGIGRAAFLQSVSDGFLRYIVEQGKTETAMRGFSAESKTAVANLTRREVDDTIAYLRANAW